MTFLKQNWFKLSLLAIFVVMLFLYHNSRFLEQGSNKQVDPSTSPVSIVNSPVSISTQTFPKPTNLDKQYELSLKEKCKSLGEQRNLKDSYPRTDSERSDLNREYVFSKSLNTCLGSFGFIVANTSGGYTLYRSVEDLLTNKTIAYFVAMSNEQGGFTRVAGNPDSITSLVEFDAYKNELLSQ
jgi:hypothetical protein